MKENVLWIVGLALLALVFLAVIMRKTFTRGRFNIGKSISGEVEGATPGATVQRVSATGDDNRVTAEGPGALVQDASVSGKGNVIGASSGLPTNKLES